MLGEGLCGLVLCRGPSPPQTLPYPGSTSKNLIVSQPKVGTSISEGHCSGRGLNAVCGEDNTRPSARTGLHSPCTRLLLSNSSNNNSPCKWQNHHLQVQPKHLHTLPHPVSGKRGPTTVQGYKARGGGLMGREWGKRLLVLGWVLERGRGLSGLHRPPMELLGGRVVAGEGQGTLSGAPSPSYTAQ